MTRGTFSFARLLSITALLCMPCLAQTALPVALPIVSPGTGPASVPITADSPRAGSQRPVEQHHDRTLKIGTGDLLQISVFGVPDLAQEARVSDSGNISMPLIGSVHVAGLSSDEAQLAIAARLRDSGMLRDPQVEVFEKE